ncbi:MAG TPA: hypothetical protein VGJ13_04540 [Pseudonocardiaceae bacterium]
MQVVNIYATPWRFTGKLRNDEGKPTDLSGLEKNYTLYKEQLPRLLPDRVLGDRLRLGAVTLAEDVDGVTVDNAKAELFMLPSKQVVLAVSMCLTDGVLHDEKAVMPIVEVLERCIDEDIKDIKIGGHLAAAALSADFAESPARDFFSKDAAGGSLLPERHQLVFVARVTPDQSVPNEQVVNKILYRRNPPYRPEFVHPRRPKQLNSNVGAGQNGSAPPPTLGVVTPYVSLLYGHENYVEASIFLSTVHAVGTAAQFRHIWREAYQQVLQFREQKQKPGAGEQTRDDLEDLADNLGNLEFDLTFSVEFPLMRIETFQSDLYDAMDLDSQANTLSRMFDQLGGSLKSEITAIEVREQRRTKLRRTWNSVAIGLLSFIGVPVGFVIAFLGINTTEVPDAPNKTSMWDLHFAPVYLIASFFALTPAFLIAVPYLWEYALRFEKRRAGRWGSGTIITVIGILIFVAALISDQYQNGFARIFDAIATAGGFFAILAGLTLLGPLVWRQFRKVRDRQPNQEGDLSPLADSRTGH